MRRCSPLCLSLALAVTAGCGGDDGAAPAGDAGRRDGGRADASRGDGGTDAGPDLCGSVTCEPFEFCVAGECRAYPSCLSMAMCPPGSVCRHRFCLPGDSDPDEDGVTAETDCDETNPDIHPGATEVCNELDDDCNTMVDDGDPGALCAMDPSGGVCIEGRCGCPEETFDIDRMPENGCECTAMPSRNEGVSCAMPIDLGDFPDSGQTMTVMGNVLPDDREVWYRFVGSDGADTSCDNYHVRVLLATNPSDVYAFYVYRGACDMESCAGMGPFTDYSWATDFRDAAGDGECPCTDGPGTAGTNNCADDTAEYFIRVVRRPGTSVACDAYALEITNGIYDT